ncbi:MAG: JAB domain-containing protein [Opitutus sp.]
MQAYQASLHYTLIQVPASDPLTKPATYVDYMAGAFQDCAHEQSLWLICMNPKCRPIARTLVRTGPLVAAMTSPRDLFRVALQADAGAIAVVRGQPGTDVTLTVHDQRALKRFGETAGWLGIKFVDYLVISTSEDLEEPLYRSWRRSAD